MTGFDFATWTRKKPVIGMIHLAPLPGAPQASGTSCTHVMERALKDAKALVDGGCHGMMVENFGDIPFFPGRVSSSVVAFMTAVALELKRHFALPLGINILRNDGLSALSVAAASGAEFIRVNVLTGTRVTDQGVIQGIAHDLMRERVAIGATHIRVLADFDVKHSAALAPRSVEDEVQDLIKRGMADGIIVSGSGTGMPVDMEKLCRVRSCADSVPVLIGSGTTASSLARLGSHADGFIVGTTFKKNGDPKGEVATSRVREVLCAHTAFTLSVGE